MGGGGEGSKHMHRIDTKSELRIRQAFEALRSMVRGVPSPKKDRYPHPALCRSDKGGGGGCRRSPAQGEGGGVARGCVDD